MNKTTAILGLLVMSSLLGGCHDNPLKTHKDEQSAAFLIKASRAATKHLQPELSLSEGKRAYLNCMNEQWIKVDCPTLYQAMADVAKKDTRYGFKALSVADLGDKGVFESIKDSYEELLFNSLEH